MNKLSLFTTLLAVALCCLALQVSAEVNQEVREKRDVLLGDEAVAEFNNELDNKEEEQEDKFPIIENGASDLKETDDDEEDLDEKAAGGRRRRRGGRRRGGKRRGGKRRGGRRKSRRGGKRRGGKRRGGNKRRGGKRRRN